MNHVTDLSKEFNPVKTPTNKRIKPKRGNHTQFTPRVREEIYRRSSERFGYMVCERCCVSVAYCFETAHLDRASQGGAGDEPWNGAILCGPSTNTGTCHHWVDSTREGREWREEKLEELIEYYRGRW